MKAQPYGFFGSRSATASTPNPCPCPPPRPKPQLTPVEYPFARHVGICRTPPAPEDVEDTLILRIGDMFKELRIVGEDEIEFYSKDKDLLAGDPCYLCLTAPVSFGLLDIRVNGKSVEYETTVIPIVYATDEPEDYYYYAASIQYQRGMKIEMR